MHSGLQLNLYTRDFAIGNWCSKTFTEQGVCSERLETAFLKCQGVLPGAHLPEKPTQLPVELRDPNPYSEIGMKQGYQARPHPTERACSQRTKSLLCRPQRPQLLVSVPLQAQVTHSMEKPRNWATWIDSTDLPLGISKTVCKLSRNSSS